MRISGNGPANRLNSCFWQRSIQEVKSVIHASLRPALAAITLFAWFVATNHCALGLMKADGPKEHENCPGHAKPDKGNDSEDSQLACCKTINAAPVPDGNVAIDSPKALFELQFAPLVAFASKVEPPLPSVWLDTGPPFVFSFAETVLQHCLLGNAPPFTS